MKYSHFLNPVKKCLQAIILLAMLFFNFGINGVTPAYAAGADLIGNAFPIPSTLPYSEVLDTTNMHTESSDPDLYDFPGGCEGDALRNGLATVWYTYNPGASTKPVFLDTSGSTTNEPNPNDPPNNYEYDTYIAVYTGSVGNLSLYACADRPDNDTNQAQLAFNALANTTYYIQIGEYDGVQSDQHEYPGYNGGILNFSMTTALTISGNAGIGGTKLSYIGGAATASSNGDYSLPIPSGLTATVTASHPLGAVYTPPTKAYNNVTSSLIGQNYTGKRTFPSVTKWTSAFDLSHGWTVAQYARTVGDVNGDGRVDLVGFGLDGVYVALAASSPGIGFGTASKWSSSLAAANGWNVANYVRTVGDVNGDDRADLVGFGLDGVYVALSNGTSFDAVSKWTSAFDLSHGWTVANYVRTVGDVNGDGRDDLVGFGLDGVYVALASNPGPGFGAISKWSGSLAAGSGWTVADYVRTVGDVNGDGRADLVGFGLDGVYVALALNPGPGFGAVSKWSSSFDLSHGWTVASYVRTVGDLNGDNKADLVGFGLDGVYVALSNGTNAFNAISKWTSAFDLSHGWTVANYVRTVGDANGDDLDDLIGFGLDGVYVAP